MINKSPDIQYFWSPSILYNLRKYKDNINWW